MTYRGLEQGGCSLHDGQLRCVYLVEGRMEIVGDMGSSGCMFERNTSGGFLYVQDQGHGCGKPDGEDSYRTTHSGFFQSRKSDLGTPDKSDPKGDGFIR